MKLTNKVIGVTLSVAMLASQAVPSMAADPTTTAGTGNVLAYNVETVVVPTTMKIALNPNTYDITTKYVKATEYDATKTYYGDANGTALSDQPADEDAFDDGTFYEAVTSNASIVSMNYGIANKSSRAKAVDVSVKASYNTVEDKTAITLVDEKNKAEQKTTTNTVGADTGELKMFLALASAQAAPTADTYQKTSDTALDDDKTYYTKGGTDAAPTYTEVDSPDVDDIKTYYESTTTIGTEVTAALLSDVNMDIATAGVQAFPEFTKGDTTSESTAKIAYGLNKATYTPKDGEIINFETNQTTLAGKLEMSALGDVAGFTLTGAINPLADWTTADATAITFTPTYKVSDATGSEEAAATGAYKQIKLGKLSSNTMTATNNSVTMTLGDDVTLTSVTLTHADGSGSIVLASGTHYTISGTTLTFVADNITTWVGLDPAYNKVVLAFSDSTSETITLQ